MADYRQYFQVVLRQPSAQVTEEFFTQSGRYSNFQKETYFLRYLCRDDRDSLLERCQRWEQDGRGTPRGCVLVPSLQRQPDQEALGRYLALCRDGQWQLPFHFENWILEEALQDGFREILGLFQESRGRAEPSILRNFAVKILFWMDQYFPRLFEETRRIASFPKFVCGGQVKLAEYLFLYLLYRMGCDVLYVGREQDVSVQDPALLGLSVVVQGPVRRQEPVPVPAASRGEGARPVLRSPQRPVKVQPPRRETPPARQR